MRRRAGERAGRSSGEPMDYNNLSSTTFADVKRVLAVAIDRVARRLPAR